MQQKAVTTQRSQSRGRYNSLHLSPLTRLASAVNQHLDSGRLHTFHPVWERIRSFNLAHFLNVNLALMRHWIFHSSYDLSSFPSAMVSSTAAFHFLCSLLLWLISFKPGWREMLSTLVHESLTHTAISGRTGSSDNLRLWLLLSCWF